MHERDISRAILCAAIGLYWKCGRNATQAVDRAKVNCAKREPESESRRRWEKIVELLETARDTGKIPMVPNTLTRAQT